MTSMKKYKYIARSIQLADYNSNNYMSSKILGKGKFEPRSPGVLTNGQKKIYLPPSTRQPPARWALQVLQQNLASHSGSSCLSSLMPQYNNYVTDQNFGMIVKAFWLVVIK